MKILSWNVNGIRAIVKKGFPSFINDESPDIVCVQETKIHYPLHILGMESYSSYWNCAERKGYAGTAIFTKVEPLSVSKGMKGGDNEGRVLTLEFKDFYLVNVYSPNSGHELQRLDYREEWDDNLREHIKRLDSKKPVILTGDLNVAHTEKDVFDAESKYDRVTKYMKREVDGFSKHLEEGFIDVFRTLYPERIEYTQWRFGGGLREANRGWRLDYFLASERILERMEEVKHLNEIEGSDHCPIILHLN